MIKKYLFFLVFLSWFSYSFCTDFFESSTVVQNHGFIAYSVDWSPDGRYLATGGANSSLDVIVYEWDGSSLNSLATEEPGVTTYSVAWSPDGRYLATGNEGGVYEVIVYEWDGASLNDLGAEAKTDHGYWVLSVAWSSDGRYLAVGGNWDPGNHVIVYEWDGSSLTVTASRHHGDQAWSVDWSPDGKFLAVGGDYGDTDVIVYEWDGFSLTNPVLKDHGDFAYSVAWSPDGRYLAVGGNNNPNDVIVYEWDGETLIDLDDGGTANKSDHGFSALSVNWSLDGRYLAVGGIVSSPTSVLDDVTIYEWDGLNLTYVEKKTHGSSAYSVAWSPYGTYLAVGGDNSSSDVIIYKRFGWIDGVLEPVSYNTSFLLNGAVGSVKFSNGIEVADGTTATLNIWEAINGTINLNTSGRIELEGDLYLGSHISGGTISGNGNTLFLEKTLTVTKVLHVASDLVIEGQGHDLEFEAWAQLFVDTDVTLTLRNLKLKTQQLNSIFPPIQLAAQGSKLALDNVILSPSDDFYFNEGQLFIHNDVCFSGGNQFIYRSSQPSFITANATLNFEPRTTFLYDTVSTYTPSDNLSTANATHLRNTDLIQMMDETSSLYLNQCTLQTALKPTHSGLRLTKGSLFFDNVVLVNHGDVSYLSSLGDAFFEEFGNFAFECSWSADGKYLAVCGEGSELDVIIYSWDGSSLTLTHSQYITGTSAYSIDWSPDGQYVAVGGNFTSYDLVVYEWDGSVLTFKDSDGLSDPGGIEVRWSPDGRFLAVGGDFTVGIDIPEIIVYGWDGLNLTVTDSKNYRISSTSGTVRTVSWHPDGRHLAVGGHPSSLSGLPSFLVYGWDGSSLSVTTSKYISPFSSGSYYGVYSVDWNSDGRYLVVGGALIPNQLLVYEWDGTDLTGVESKFDLKSDSVPLSVDWSPDGLYLATGSLRNTGDVINPEFVVYRWDGLDLKLTDSKHLGGGATTVQSVSWNPTQQSIGMCGGNVSQDIAVYNVNYTSQNIIPEPEQGLIFGDSSHGSDYDLNIFLLGGAKLEIKGSVAYDNAG